MVTVVWLYADAVRPEPLRVGAWWPGVRRSWSIHPWALAARRGHGEHWRITIWWHFLWQPEAALCIQLSSVRLRQPQLSRSVRNDVRWVSFISLRAQTSYWHMQSETRQFFSAIWRITLYIFRTHRSFSQSSQYNRETFGILERDFCRRMPFPSWPKVQKHRWRYCCQFSS